jgi:hypothetical protein
MVGKVDFMAPKFPLGRIVSTPAALEAFARNSEDPMQFLARHVVGDWGELDDHDKAENYYSLNNHLRILSAYSLKDGTKIWIITEADRSATTFLLPSDY